MAFNERERLYINNIEIELTNDTTSFARTLQVNDLMNLENRQSNFTKNILVPKTPKNLQTFDWLGVVGNQSNMPYQQNTASYIVGNEYLIYNGLALINDTDDYYNITIYDGAIDLYKAIDNKTLGDLDISALTHSKNLETVINSFSSTTLPYKYILADYGGKTQYKSVVSGVTASTINIDYLVPSVKVSYLWEKIYEKYNFTYSGNVFSSDDFKNLYLTYPKPINNIGILTPIFQQDYCRFEQYTNAFSHTSLYFEKAGSSVINHLLSIYDDRHFKVAETGTYKIRFSGIVKPRVGSTRTTAIDIWIGKNSESVSDANNLTGFQKIVENIGGGDSDTNYPFDGELYITLNAGESICMFGRAISGYVTSIADSNVLRESLKFFIDKVDGGSPDFAATLKQFSTKDFLNEVLQRFSLTPFKNKYTNEYVFKTLNEVININNVCDYSDKFLYVISEKYLYGSYAQKNNFKYKYNDNNSTYNDGYISCGNLNLNDSKDVIQSKIYSPEKDLSNELGYETNTYKIWTKELNNNGEIAYKELDNRFQFLRFQNKTFSSRRIGSETLLTVANITSAPSENFGGLSFQDVITNYYLDFSKILNKSKIITAKLNLSLSDVSDFDFSRLYFIKQLAGYFLINKITNFQLNKATQVELIQVNFES